MNHLQEDINIFASLKYEGELVKDGFMDARKAGEILINVDEALRYFLFQESKQLKQSEFEIPVRIRKGSWETVFLENFDAILLKTVIGWGASKYFGSALSEMAKNDFKDIGFKSIFKNAYKSMTWVLKIAIHLGSLAKKKFDKLTFSKNNELVQLENEKGEIIDVPVKYLEIFSNCPPDLFAILARIIEIERELVIAYNDKEKSEKQFVRVKANQKQIFIPESDEDEILFPELEHNNYVELEGHITRGNENSNTIGFMYQNHIITSYPQEGNIKNFKNALFTNCIIKGYIDRLDKKTGEFNEKRPRIRFIELISNEPNNNQTRLF